MVAQYGEALYATILLPKLGVPEEARDLLRETFLTAFERIETFSWLEGGMYPWLRRIAQNKAIDRLRARTRERRFQTGYGDFVELAEPPPSAERALLAAEEQARNKQKIQQALSQITERYREAIELRVLEERSREDCAARLSVSVSTFDVILFRAMAAFRKAFLQLETP